MPRDIMIDSWFNDTVPSHTNCDIVKYFGPVSCKWTTRRKTYYTAKVNTKTNRFRCSIACTYIGSVDLKAALSRCVSVAGLNQTFCCKVCLWSFIDCSYSSAVYVLPVTFACQAENILKLKHKLSAKIENIQNKRVWCMHVTFLDQMSLVR